MRRLWSQISGWLDRPRQGRKRNLTVGCRRLRFEPLEGRHVLSAAFAEFVDPHPTIGDNFGISVVPLSTGNVVVTAPNDDAGGKDAGAVYLFNGRTGELISTLTGSHFNDEVGRDGVTPLANGNFVVLSSLWGNGTVRYVGAVTWGSGTTGVSGVVSASNSLVGSADADSVGLYGVVLLTNGNYVVRSPFWNGGMFKEAGAVTWASGPAG